MNKENDLFEQAKHDPRTAQLVSKLSPSDAERLRSVLSSPESIKQILSTDKARQILGSLGLTGGRKNDE